MIRISDLAKSFNGKIILDGLDLDLPPQGIVGLTGPSGCGKTTLLRLLAGLLAPDRGSVLGLDPGDISMVFQEDRLLPWLTAQDNLSAVLHDRQLAQVWLEKVRLGDSGGLYPAELSGGMKRRVALARALAFPSAVLFLDEPFQGIDNERRQIMHDLVRETARTRLVLLITHDVADLASLADRILVAGGPPLRLAG